ncbi:MAG: GGDEF domain-containing protein [Clostridium sp.]|nr:GGDEF domain-containing protein [Clostridium sp.]
MFFSYDNILSLLSTEEAKKNSSVILIKDNNRQALNRLKTYITENDDKSLCFFDNMEKRKLYEPYYPFLKFIREKECDENNLDYLFSSTDIYPAYKRAFSTYINFNRAERDEELIPFDYRYEKIKLFESIRNIFNGYSRDNNVYIFIENINYISTSALKWIKWLITDGQFNFNIIASLTEDDYYNEAFQDEFDNLIDAIEMKYTILENNTQFDEREEIILTSHEKQLIEDDCFLIGQNNFTFLALEEALRCFKKEKMNFEQNSVDYPSDKKEKVLKRIGDIYLLKGDYRNAHFYYGLLLKLGLKDNNKHLKARAFQKLSMVEIFRMDFDKAENYAKGSYKIARDINDGYLIFKAYELIFWINEKGKYRTTIEDTGYEDEFIKLAKLFNKKNRLAYFLTHTYNKISFIGKEDESIELYDEGHRIARELKNENCILSAHLKTALVYAVSGLNEISQKYYMKVEKGLLEIKDEFKLAQTYNGMGYYCLVRGEYEKGYEYYNKALKNLKRNWNFDEICMTLINESINAIMAYDYKSAERQLETLFFVIKKLKFSRLRLISLTKVYGIMALNNFYLGNYYKSYSFLSKIQIMKKNEKFYEDDEEYFLKFFTQGLMMKNKGRFKEAEEYFKYANEIIEKIKGSIKCFYPKFLFEYYNLMIAYEKPDEAERIKRIGCTYCDENNIDMYLKLFNNEPVDAVLFKSSSSQNQWIIEGAKQQSAIMLLNNKMDEINFINSFQEILTSADDKDKVINECIMLLENNFGIDYSLLVFNDGYEKEIMYSKNSMKVSSEKLEQFFYLTKNYSAPFVSNDNGEMNDFVKTITGCEVKSLIYIPVIKDGKCIMSFLCTTNVDEGIVKTKIVLDESDFNIITIAVKQLFESVQKIKWQEKLIESVSTDMLTKLYNRQYFYEKISLLLDEEKKDEIGRDITLFYLDLDNFKYYNDTFGHSIGDNVLIWFADILKSLSDENTIAVRFGGDEFILLSLGCDISHAKEQVEYIYKRINEHYGFINEIENLLNEKISIPDNKRLGCSIGISNKILSRDFNVSRFIDEADTALYEAKRSGKGRYKIYGLYDELYI